MTSGDTAHDAPPAGTRFLVLLGMPAMGMALVVTVISTYLPVLVAETSGPVLVGVLIGGEGFFGIFMPALVGAWSDRHTRRVRDRVPLLVGFAVVVVLAMVAIGVLAGAGARSFTIYAGILVFAYAGYYAFLAPYWSLYPDLVPHDRSGRSRSAEGTWRVAGVGLGLVAGGLLLDVWVGLPFIVSAGIAAGTVVVLVLALRSRLGVALTPDDSGPGTFHGIRDLLRVPGIAKLCVCEGLWNFALASLRTFVVLFFVMGLDRSSSFVSAVIFPLVAVGIAVAAPTAGWFSDRFGAIRVLLVAGTVYAVMMAVPAFTTSPWVVATIPLVAAGAAVVMTQPFAVMMRMIPRNRHGAASGLFGLSHGLGATLGPVVTGVAVVVLRPVFRSTDGYAAMWLVCSAALLCALPLLWSLRKDERL